MLTDRSIALCHKGLVYQAVALYNRVDNRSIDSFKTVGEHLLIHFRNEKCVIVQILKLFIIHCRFVFSCFMKKLFYKI